MITPDQLSIIADSLAPSAMVQQLSTREYEILITWSGTDDQDRAEYVSLVRDPKRTKTFKTLDACADFLASYEILDFKVSIQMVRS